MEGVFCSECQNEINPKISKFLDNNKWRCNACETKYEQTRTALKNASKESPHTIKEKRTFPEHIIIIQGDPPLYKCTIDDKTFKSKSHCCYHKHCPDVNEKPFVCSTCDRRFASKTHLSYHNLTHTGISPYKCDQCDKSFKTKNKLRRHEQVHSDERKLYPCKNCDKSFLTRASLKVHRRIHTGEKPYTCSYCSKAFTEKKKLINHISCHTRDKNFSCQVCGKSFSIKSSLEIHKKTHSNVKLYKCRDCPQVFSQNRYLKRHLETHKNSAKNSCNLCDKKFSRKDNLKRHILNIHEDLQNSNNFDVNKYVFNLDETKITKTNLTNGENTAANNAANTSKNVPSIRTESVIKSLTKSQEIINFDCKEIESMSNRTSVIKKIDKDLEKSNPVNSVIVTDPVNYCTRKLVDRIPEEMNLEDSVQNLEYVRENSILISNQNVDKETSVFASSCYQDDRVKSPRCLLPKKLFVASYKEKLDEMCCNSVDLSVIKTTWKKL